MSVQTDQQQLLDLIENRRRSVKAYLKKARPRADRLLLVSIISSALAAALTAGPALGGPELNHSLAVTLGAGKDSSIWRVLCLLAMVVSVIAAISANLSRAKGGEARIINAETCLAELEGLQTMIEFQQVPVPEAVKLYQQYVAKVPYIDSDLSETRSSQARAGKN
ncbi:MAG TPA: hypothetical protein VEQ66_02965 [Propionibacteriaceae bacterium]|nr:hypothetical protein [Propionibacteriaceae bacterium]